MAIIAKKSGGDFTPCPAGTYPAVCIDVVDLGMVETVWEGQKKSQHKVRLVWQVDERMADGKPFLVKRRYTLSLDDRAALRKDLETWRGRGFTPQELDGFDVEMLIGIGCMVSIVHKKNAEGKTFDNVASVMRLPRGLTAPVVESYVRVKDRPKDDADAQMPNDEDVPQASSVDDLDSVPF
jgi:hypothetical protein